MRVAANDVGHDGSVNDAQTLNASDFEIGRDNRHGIVMTAHFASTNWVITRCDMGC